MGGIRFVFDKIATAVDSERNDPGRLREILLDAEMKHEAGEITDDELATLQDEVFARLREIEGGARQPITVGSGATAEVELAFDGGTEIAPPKQKKTKASKGRKKRARPSK